MNLKMMILILVSVSFSAIAQMVLKLGMSAAAVSRAIAAGTPAGIAYAVCTSPGVVGGLSLYFASAVLWLFVLARLELSVAYPFVGLGFIFTLLLGRFFMGDVISGARLGGTLLVSVGVVLIARS